MLKTCREFVLFATKEQRIVLQWLKGYISWNLTVSKAQNLPDVNICYHSLNRKFIMTGRLILLKSQWQVWSWGTHDSCNTILNEAMAARCMAAFQLPSNLMRLCSIPSNHWPDDHLGNHDTEYSTEFRESRALCHGFVVKLAVAPFHNTHWSWTWVALLFHLRNSCGALMEAIT